ncbi:hypothetical protein B0J12DRAFT_671260, partial [Macrophomina phaseolina]
MDGIQHEANRRLPEYSHHSDAGVSAHAAQLGSLQLVDMVEDTYSSKAEQAKVPNGPPMDCESYPEVYHETLPEVKVDHNSFPEVAGNDALRFAGCQARRSAHSKRNMRCGLPKTWFWILICVSMLDITCFHIAFATPDSLVAIARIRGGRVTYPLPL